MIEYFAEEHKKDSEIEYSDEEENGSFLEDEKMCCCPESSAKPKAMQVLKPAVKVCSASPKAETTEKVVPKDFSKSAVG